MKNGKWMRKSVTKKLVWKKRVRTKSRSDRATRLAVSPARKSPLFTVDNVRKVSKDWEAEPRAQIDSLFEIGQRSIIRNPKKRKVVLAKSFHRTVRFVQLIRSFEFTSFFLFLVSKCETRIIFFDSLFRKNETIIEFFKTLFRNNETRISFLNACFETQQWSNSFVASLPISVSYQLSIAKTISNFDLETTF